MSAPGPFPGIMEYFSEIEEFFCAQRSAPLLLSPIDFEKAVSWHDAGIPVDVVKRGVAAYFEKLSKRKTPLRRAICLSFSEDCVLKALEEHRLASIGSACGIGAAPADADRRRRFLSGLVSSFEAVLARKGELRGYPRSFAFAEAVIGILSAMSRDEKLSLADMETKLAPLDAELGRLIVSEAEEDLVAEWKEEAVQTLRKAGIKDNPAAAAAVERKTMTKRAFALLGAPRLSILYFNE